MCECRCGCVYERGCFEGIESNSARSVGRAEAKAAVAADEGREAAAAGCVR